MKKVKNAINLGGSFLLCLNVAEEKPHKPQNGRKRYYVTTYA